MLIETIDFFSLKFWLSYQILEICLIFLPKWKKSVHVKWNLSIIHGLYCLTSLIWSLILTVFPFGSCLYCEMLAISRMEKRSLFFRTQVKCLNSAQYKHEAGVRVGLNLMYFGMMIFYQLSSELSSKIMIPVSVNANITKQ